MVHPDRRSAVPASTTEGLEHHSPTHRRVRIGASAALAALVILGATGLLGPTTGSTSASAGTWALHVQHPSVTRPGQPAPLVVRVVAADGFDGPVRLALDTAMFERMDFQGWFPTPSKETAEADRVVYEFDPPTGDELRVTLDARTAPGQLFSRTSYDVSLLVPPAPEVTARFTVWTLP